MAMLDFLRLVSAVLVALPVITRESDQESAEEVFRTAEEWARADDYAEALVKLDRVIELEPGHVMAWNWRGHCYAALGDYDAALASYARALELQPDYPWSHYAMGMSLHNLGRLEEAAHAYSLALELQPDNVKALQWRGFTHGVLGDHQGAIADLTAALVFDPTDAWTWLQRGKAYVAARLFLHAEIDFRKVIELTPSDPAPHEMLGYLHLLGSNDEQALAHLRQAVDLSADSAVHPMIWIAFIANRAAPDDEDARGALERWREEHRGLDGWEPILAAFLLDRGDPGELVAHAKELERFRISNGEPTDDLVLEAYYYIGFSHSLNGADRGAINAFRVCLALGPKVKWEWEFARSGLRDAAERLGWSPDPGFRVALAEDGGSCRAIAVDAAAVEQGLQSGDRLLAVDGRPATPASFETKLGQARVGDVWRVRVSRGAEPIEVTIVVGADQP
jgi:tetratricopeptide (TPR) repeat protein